MARRLPLIINGVDFTEAASRLEYSIIYEDRTGANAGMMLNGDEYLDIIARRPVITWQLNLLWAEELAALQAAIDADEYVAVTYFDTKQGKETQGYFHGTLSEQQLGILRDAETIFRGPVLTLKSR